VRCHYGNRGGGGSQTVADFFVAIFFVCSFHRSFRSNVIIRCLNFVDQGIECMIKVNLCRCSWERRVKSIALLK
jgi:hypothetical protein